MKRKILITLFVISGTILTVVLVFFAIVGWLFVDWALHSGYSPIVEGEYVREYVNSDGVQIYVHITITPIDYDTYLEAGGINVVMDEAYSVPHRWYAIDCEYSVDGGETVKVQFINLQPDIHEDPHASQYIDDNGNILTVGSYYNVQYYDVWFYCDVRHDKI